jgi:threonine dehydrogenase-like Zn-dependent dehydrogenase
MMSVAVVKPYQLEVVEIPDPNPGPYEAVLETELSFICNATDRKLVQGHFPGLQSEDNYPLLLGHETVGKVVGKGERVRTFEIGDRVIGGLLLKATDSRYTSGWGGFSELVLAVDENAMKIDGIADRAHGYDELWQIMKIVSPDIPLEAAGLLCTWREVYAAVNEFMIKPTDTVLIFGAGPVGLSFVKFLKLRGGEFVYCVDPLDSRRNMAEKMGADLCSYPDWGFLHEYQKKSGEKFDVIIDAVGSQEIISRSISLLKTAGKLCVYGVLSENMLTVDKSRAPYNFNLFVHQWPTRNLEAEAQEPLCTWIRSGLLDASDFVTGGFHFNEISEAMKEVESSRNIKTSLHW